jgi:hypothetical protein
MRRHTAHQRSSLAYNYDDGTQVLHQYHRILYMMALPIRPYLFVGDEATGGWWFEIPVERAIDVECHKLIPALFDCPSSPRATQYCCIDTGEMRASICVAQAECQTGR